MPVGLHQRHFFIRIDLTMASNTFEKTTHFRCDGIRRRLKWAMSFQGLKGSIVLKDTKTKQRWCGHGCCERVTAFDAWAECVHYSYGATPRLTYGYWT